MRTKALLTSILLATSALAGVASADPYIRDHREQPVVTVQPAISASFHGAVNIAPRTAQPYGFQLTASGEYAQPYSYGLDPVREYTPRSSWATYGSYLRWNASTVNGMVIKTYGNALNAIELQAQGGCTNIRQVMVQLNDGELLRVRTMRDLDDHAPNLRVDLTPYQSRIGVKNVTIFGSGTGQFRLIGA